MIIVAGYTLAEADKRDAAVETLAEMIERGRKHDGCFDLSMSADSVDSERINVFECWRDEQSWKAWRKVANPPRVKLGKSYVNLYRSETAERL